VLFQRCGVEVTWSVICFSIRTYLYWWVIFFSHDTPSHLYTVSVYVPLISLHHASLLQAQRESLKIPFSSNPLLFPLSTTPLYPSSRYLTIVLLPSFKMRLRPRSHSYERRSPITLRPEITLTRHRHRRRRLRIRMDPDCAICSQPALARCECESKGLDTAVRQAEQRMMAGVFTEIRYVSLPLPSLLSSS
jgi:hypothetical protein